MVECAAKVLACAVFFADQGWRCKSGSGLKTIRRTDNRLDMSSLFRAFPAGKNDQKTQAG